MGGTARRKRSGSKEYLTPLKNWEETSITLLKELFKARKSDLRSTTILRLPMASTVPPGQFSKNHNPVLLPSFLAMKVKD